MEEMANKAYSKAIPELIRNNIIAELIERDIKETKDGISIYDLTQKQLARELGRARFMDISVDSPENKWF